MVPDKSLDDSYSIIAALLCDVQNAHGGVFNARSLRLTLKKVKSRLATEGMGFLTKTLPRLGKAFDKALAGITPLNAAALGFKPMCCGSSLPRFLGELISCVLSSDGILLPSPCALCVRDIRAVLYLFYKYELPYTEEQEHKTVQQFLAAEHDLLASGLRLQGYGAAIGSSCIPYSKGLAKGLGILDVTRAAKLLMDQLFADFDPLDIHPRHGPGAVATKQQLWDKFHWVNVSSNITSMYPLDAYYCASLGHVCDAYNAFLGITEEDLSARVILVPKDSRGPRLISCEPVDYQWIQQGLGRAIVKHVESHPLTRECVRFTDQQPNQFGALLGSLTGRYATLDLKEASDRVSVDLVRLLFPERLLPYLEACRSSSTILPDGRIIKLRKFAPMGSSLCFPVLALTIWAILSGAAPDRYTRERVYVYGDDVIVPTAFAENAIEQLESFGLLVNRDKSCIRGLFRESCGTDAFKGVNVTPVRLRTVWSSSRSPDVYTSWIAYANSFYDRRYYTTYDFVVSRLLSVYGQIPEDRDVPKGTCPTLRSVPPDMRPIRTRVNRDLQRLQHYVWVVKSPSINKKIDGWSMLLRYFSEATSDSVMPSSDVHISHGVEDFNPPHPFRVRSYTRRGTSMLVKRWR